MTIPPRSPHDPPSNPEGVLPPTQLLRPGDMPARDDASSFVSDDVECTQLQPLRPAHAGEGPFTPEIPGYEILEILGRGGMGVVYKARQLGLNRLVALKMILAGQHAEHEDRDRFHYEAESIAKLAHPCIVQIHETGEVNGMPYFSMEYCNGGSLARYLKGNPIDPELAARLTQQLADGIHTAHQVQIIHRDLKPGNILLQVPDVAQVAPNATENTALIVGSAAHSAATLRRYQSIPDNATPKITDFGLAKPMNDEGPRTKTGWILGTPSYMAPEQARASVRELGPATDIYALGSILYEMLTGRPPFKAANDIDTLHQLVRDEPIPPARLEPKIPRDLETICLKCLEKDPRKRYISAEDLAADLARFQESEPISARPVGSVERAWRWMRKRPTTAAVVVSSGVALSAGLVLWASFTAQLQSALEDLRVQESRTDLALHYAQESRARAEEQLEIAQKGLYAHRLLLADREAERGKYDRAMELLDECRWDLRGWEWRHLMLRCEGARALPPRPAERIFEERKGHKIAMAFHGGDRLITGADDGTILVWDVLNGRPFRTLVRHPDRLSDMAIHPASNRILSTGRNGSMMLSNLQTGNIERNFPRQGRPIEAIAFHPDGQHFATFDRYHLRYWNIAGDRPIHESRIKGFNDHCDFATLAFSPSGKYLCHPDERGQVVVRKADTGEIVIEFQGHTRQVRSVAFHPDNDRIVSAANDGIIKLWSIERAGIISTLNAHRDAVNEVTFNADGSRIVSVGQDRAFFIWDTATGQELLSRNVFTHSVESVAFGPDGLTLATLDQVGQIRIFDALPERGNLSFRTGSVVSCVRFNPSGERIITGTHEGVIQLWDAHSGKELFHNTDHRHTVTGISFLPGNTMQFLSVDGDPHQPLSQRPYEFKLWDLAIGRPRLSLIAHQSAISRLAVDPTGSMAATACMDWTCRVWDIHRGALAAELKAPCPLLDIAFQPQGQELAAAGFDHQIHVWDWKAGRRLPGFVGHSQPVIALAFSRDGSTLVSAAARVDPRAPRAFPAELIVWDVATRQERFRIAGANEPIWQIRFHPSDRLFATAGGRLAQMSTIGEVKIWDVRTGQLLRDFPEQNGTAFGIDFSPDGRRMVTAGGDRMVRLWEVPELADEEPD